MSVIPVHSSLGMGRDCHGEIQCFIIQVSEFPGGAKTNQIVLTLEKMESMIETFYKTKAAITAVEEAFEEKGRSDGIITQKIPHL